MKLDLSLVIVDAMRQWMAAGKVPPAAEIGMVDFMTRASAQVAEMQDRMKAGDTVSFNDYTSSADEIVGRHRQRDLFIKEFGFAIPCAEAIEACAAYAPLVEVGAGSGYWAKLIAHRAGPRAVVATDPVLSYQFQFKHGSYYLTWPLQAKTAVRRFPDRNVLLVWPGLDATWPTQCLKAMRVGRVLLSVDEGAGGCCGADSYFAVLGDCFEEITTIELPMFDGIHDRMTVWLKKRPYRRDRLDWPNIDTRTPEQKQIDFQEFIDKAPAMIKEIEAETQKLRDAR